MQRDYSCASQLRHRSRPNSAKMGFLDIFSTRDLTSILKNRFIVVIGDSIQRGIYKDIVLILQNDRTLTEGELRSKGEFSFLGDELIEGGKKDKMTNGISYKEVRQYHTNVHLVRFYFMTRCYNSYLETILRDLKDGPMPDVVIMNSCLWDITRYGMDSIKDYKENLRKLFTRFQESLPKECLIIWATALPISSSARGGFLVPEIEFMSTTLRLDILEANYFAKTLATEHGLDVLDLHYYLRNYLHCRVKDGIHWDMMAHRYITNLLMNHVCEAWNIPPPSKTRDSCDFVSSDWDYGYGSRTGTGFGHGTQNLKWNNALHTWRASLLPTPSNGRYCYDVSGWGHNYQFDGIIQNFKNIVQNFNWHYYEQSAYQPHARRQYARQHATPYSRSQRR